jgi:hypothetical protein
MTETGENAKGFDSKRQAQPRRRVLGQRGRARRGSWVVPLLHKVAELVRAVLLVVVVALVAPLRAAALPVAPAAVLERVLVIGVGLRHRPLVPVKFSVE